jgi:hypothetical protein
LHTPDETISVTVVPDFTGDPAAGFDPTTLPLGTLFEHCDVVEDAGVKLAAPRIAPACDGVSPVSVGTGYVDDGLSTISVTVFPVRVWVPPMGVCDKTVLGV